MADGSHFKNCCVRYLSNHFTDFGKICIAMHISHFNPISDQIGKFENPRWQMANMLKIE